MGPADHMAVLWLGRLAGAGTFVPRFLDSNDQHRVVQALAALGGIQYRGSIRGYFDRGRRAVGKANRDSGPAATHPVAATRQGGRGHPLYELPRHMKRGQGLHRPPPSVEVAGCCRVTGSDPAPRGPG